MVQQEVWPARCHHLVLAAQGRQVVWPSQPPVGAAFQVLRGPMIRHCRPCVCTNGDGLADRGIIFLLLMVDQFNMGFDVHRRTF